MNEETIAVQGHVSGLRWCGLYEFLHTCSYAHHVTLTITEERKGWVRTTIFFTLTGARTAVHAYAHELRNAIERMNTDES